MSKIYVTGRRSTQASSRCARCGETKPATEFTKGNKKNGLHSYCRPCNNAAAKASVERFRSQATEASKTWVNQAPGQCQGVVNLGAFTQRFLIRCTHQASAGGYCLKHADEKTARVSRTMRPIIEGKQSFGSEEYRRRIEREKREALDALRSDPELADLLDQQIRDSRWGHFVGTRPWLVSLDSPVFDDGGDRYDHPGQRWLSGYVTDEWVDVVIAVTDRRREIDSYADAA